MRRSLSLISFFLLRDKRRAKPQNTHEMRHFVYCAWLVVETVRYDIEFTVPIAINASLIIYNTSSDYYEVSAVMRLPNIRNS